LAVVLPHHHHGDVDVIVGTANRDPPWPARVPPRRDAGAVEQLPRHLGPLAIGQNPVGLPRPADKCHTGPRPPSVGRSGSPAASTGARIARVSGPRWRSPDRVDAVASTHPCDPTRRSPATVHAPAPDPGAKHWLPPAEFTPYGLTDTDISALTMRITFATGPRRIWIADEFIG
jgi:hypothetical protein